MIADSVESVDIVAQLLTSLFINPAAPVDGKHRDRVAQGQPLGLGLFQDTGHLVRLIAGVRQQQLCQIVGVFWGGFSRQEPKASAAALAELARLFGISGGEGRWVDYDPEDGPNVADLDAER